MNIRNLSLFSKIMIFFLPVFLVAGFITAALFQFFISIDTNKKIDRTNEYIDYINNVFNDDDLMYKENVSALKALLNNELKYSGLLFDGFWLYKILLVDPDGDITDIETASAEEAASEDYEDSLKPVNLVIGNAQLDKTYTLYIIELNSFIYKTPDGEMRQFPEIVLAESNGERLTPLSHLSLIKQSSIANNSVDTFYNTKNDLTASYSYLKIDFTLNASNNSFTCSLPPSWSNWWKSDVSCSSITVENKPA